MSCTEIKREPEWTEEMFTHCEYSVKEELLLAGQDNEMGCEDAGVSTDPSVTDDAEGLYADHEVKGELVLGPETLQPSDRLFSIPDVSLKPFSGLDSVGSEPSALVEEQTDSDNQTTGSIVQSATHTGSKLFSCYVRLERCPVLSELNNRLINNNTKMPQVSPEKETSKNHHKPRQRRKYRFKNLKRRVEGNSLSESTKRLMSKHGMMPPASPEKERRNKNHHAPKRRRKLKQLKRFRPSVQVEADLMEYTDRVNKAKQNAHRIHLRGAGTSNATFMNGNAYVCKVCMEEFEDQPSLDKHALMHRGEVKFACGVCERQFAKISYFEAHARMMHSDHCNVKMKIIVIENNIDVIKPDIELLKLEKNYNSDVMAPTNTGNIHPEDKSNLTELEKNTQNLNDKKPVKAKNSSKKLEGRTRSCNNECESESGSKQDETKTQNLDEKTPKVKTKKPIKKVKKRKYNSDLMKFEIKTKNLDAMKLIKVKTNNSDKKLKTKLDPEAKTARKKMNKVLQKLKKDPEDAEFVVSYFSTVHVRITGSHLLDHNYHRAAQDARFVDRMSLATYGRLSIS